MTFGITHLSMFYGKQGQSWNANYEESDSKLVKPN